MLTLIYLIYLKKTHDSVRKPAVFLIDFTVLF